MQEVKTSRPMREKGRKLLKKVANEPKKKKKKTHSKLHTEHLVQNSSLCLYLDK